MKLKTVLRPMFILLLAASFVAGCQSVTPPPTASETPPPNEDVKTPGGSEEPAPQGDAKATPRNETLYVNGLHGSAHEFQPA